MKRQLQKKIGTIVFFIFATILLVFFVKTFLLFSVMPKSQTIFSVENTNDIVFISPFLRPGNRIITIVPSALKVGHGDLVLVNDYDTDELPFFKRLLRNAVSFFTLNKIVLFSNHPSSLSNASLLRVLACPGDSVYMKDFVVYVKKPDSQFYLTEFEISKKEYEIRKGTELYEGHHPVFKALQEMEPITLNAGEYFLLSDDRLASFDSRFWGPVFEKSIKGKALFRLQLFKDASFL